MAPTVFSSTWMSKLSLRISLREKQRRYLRHNFESCSSIKGAFDAVNAGCMFCRCGSCCPCGSHTYIMQDAERATRRRADMRHFDARVKDDYQTMRIMYDKI